MDYLLGVDVGSSSVKTALFDVNGHMAALSIQEYELIFPAPHMVEIAPETFWEKFKCGVADLLASSQIDPEQIKALAISSQGETFITLDKDGQPLRHAIFWYDNRSTKEAELLAKTFSQQAAYEVTGMPEMIPMWTAGKILWLKANEPELFSKVHKYLLVSDYLVYRLTGQYVGEYSCYPSTMLLDIQKKHWWPQMLSVLDISPDQLVELKESGEPVATIRPAVASQLGLSPRTLVATGAYDHAAGAIGSGNIRPGIVTETTGSALVVNTTLSKATFDPAMLVPCQYHAMKDNYFLSSFSETGGMAFKWYRNNFYLTGSESPEVIEQAYTAMDNLADDIPPGSDGLIMLPHLAGAFCPESNPNARGVLFGLALKHGKGHVSRAILEAVAFMLKRHIQVVEEMGIVVNEIIGIGGGARSRIWGQIKADVLEKPVAHITTEEPSLLGAAILAGKAAGIYKDLLTASERMVQVRKRFEPNPVNRAGYQDVFARYVAIYDRLADVFPKQRDLS